MAYNNQGPLLQNMAMQQKQQLLSDQQAYDYSSTPYTKNPPYNYSTENIDSNNQEIYVHNSLNEPIMTSLMRDLNRIYSKLKIEVLCFLNWLITFVFVVSAYVIFRANRLADGILMIKRMFLINHEGGMFLMRVISQDAISIILIITGFILIWLPLNSNQLLEKFKPCRRTLYFASLCFLFSILVRKNEKRRV
mgnify:CR=1 FL=1